MTMSRLKELVKLCKDHKVNPWYLEDLAFNGSYDLVEDNLLSYEDNAILVNSSDGLLKQAIMEIYFNNDVADLPEEIIETIENAIRETNYEAWGLVTDWLTGVNDYNFDSIMAEWLDNNNDRILAAYSYILNQEV